MLFRKYFPLFILVVSAQANHSHARRSLAIRSSIRRQGLFSDLGNNLDGTVEDVVGDLLGDNDPQPTPTPTPTPPPPVVSSSPDSFSSVSLTDLPTSTFSSTPIPTPSTTKGGLLGDLGSAVDGVTSDLGGAVTGILGGGDHSSPTPSPTPVATTSLLPPVSIPPTDSSSSGSSDGSSTGTDTNSASSSGPAPPSVTPSPASSDNGGGVLGPVTSLLGGVVTDILPPDTTSSNPSSPSEGASTTQLPSDGVSTTVPPDGSTTDPGISPPFVTASPTSSSSPTDGGGILSPVTSLLGGVLGPDTSGTTPSPSDTSASTTTDSPVADPGSTSGPSSSTITPPPSASSSSTGDGGIIGAVTSILGGVVGGSTSSSGSAPPPETTNPPDSTFPPPDSTFPPPDSTFPPADSTTISDFPTTSLLPPIDSNPTSSFSSVLPIDSGNGTTSASPTISFPSPTSSSATSGVADETSSAATVTSTVVTTFSVEPGLSFVLTEPSLAYASVPTTSSVTITDPDAATTTADVEPVSATTLIAPAPLPTGIPARIFPREQLDLSDRSQFNGYTLISILFNNELNWLFVVNSTVAPSQLFVYTPVLITTALGISIDQIKAYALQVYVPTSYQGPSDASLLGCTWVGWIPSGDVDTLAAQIKIKSSPFYSDAPDGPPKELANRVVSGYDILSVDSPISSSGGGSNGDNGGSGDSGDNGKSRQDAIIGVVSALGAIALLVLVFLVYRSMKRRKALAHRRLSDPPDEVLGVRPEGREFDQDSVGGARRRSFYYAEDSLRVYEQTNVHDENMSQVMSQRRPVVQPGDISVPVLTGSTMNW